MGELSKQYWSMANAVTALSVAQSLAFAYALASPSGDNIRSQTHWVTIGIVAAVIAFCVAVWFCNHAQTKLLINVTPQEAPLETVSPLLRITMLGRMAAITGYSIFAIVLLLATG